MCPSVIGAKANHTLRVRGVEREDGDVRRAEDWWVSLAFINISWHLVDSLSQSNFQWVRQKNDLDF